MYPWRAGDQPRPTNVTAITSAAHQEVTPHGAQALQSAVCSPISGRHRQRRYTLAPGLAVTPKGLSFEKVLDLVPGLFLA